ncbi:GGDEF domain-containing protein [Shewanella sp. 4t3-1-2LB]|jgi:diguanylate cyclase (GGDEF)-like protein|uniref:sensor domain-containing diguanylate cyclase n=1 Tax=Shewanella sp. 4t3-1-2LB TaxID=2817682 RepID=UPI001A9835C9|nr:sensor domain-containing diguanylate cyclase [Shewanella sp. 4t3-1-2LB]MBO1271910.1 GGDEF domain-containing protein [Shewanella sp. 4t3-1-2LB]
MLRRHQPLANVRNKMLWLFSGLLFLVFFVMSWSSYHVAQKSISRQIEQNSLPLTSDNVYSQIQRDLVQPIFVATLMAHDTFVRDWALQPAPPKEPMQRYLQEIDRRFGTIISFFVLDKSRRYYLPDTADHIIDEHSHRYEWYEQVKALPQSKPYLVTVGPDEQRPGKMDIYIDHQVYDYQQQLIGVTGVGLSVDKVGELINLYEKRYQRTIYFVDQQGKVVLHGENFTGAATLQQMPGMQQIALRLLSAPSGSFHYVLSDEKVYVNARLVPEFNWYLVVEEHASPAQQAVFRTFMINLAIAIVITLLVLGLSLLTQGRYQRKLAAQAALDPLTKAMNRQTCEEFYELLLEQCRHQHQSLSVLVFDVDYFKSVNDKYGHDMGDLVLKRLVKELRSQTRYADAVCRWGGEEFVLLLGNCNREKAWNLAERMRQRVMALDFNAGTGTFQITLSCGVAEARLEEDLAEVVKRADAALYRAKDSGRNQVLYADE